ncbi:MAG: S41 family peptidase, partial [Myxococcota bacterium]
VRRPPARIRRRSRHTKGQYGGVGMVLSIRNHELTVIDPREGGPALEAGIKKGDKIVQINERSTVNMPLTEAVNLIRGPADTKVHLWIKRLANPEKHKNKNKEKKLKPFEIEWTKPKKYTLVRRRININSVSSRILKNKIAYFRIDHFISKTAADLRSQYQKILKKAQKLNGIILDLKHNPGGLLPQAINVANLFVDDGLIVSTEGAPGSKKIVRKANPETTLSKSIPMAIIISPNSASGSEIVGGTLKNLNRAVLIGDTTYGKGTVQQIFSKSKDKPALKLTIRQYLTAGNISIQQVGVVPHIKYIPIGFKEGMSMFWHTLPDKKNKKNSFIESSKTKPPEKPRYKITYYQDKIDKREYSNSVDDFAADDKVIDFARRILFEHGKPLAEDTLNSVSNFIDQEQKKEQTVLSSALKTKGINWIKGKLNLKDPDISTQIVLCDKKEDPNCESPLDAVDPGKKYIMKVIVKNLSDFPLYQVYGISESPSDILGGEEFLFGKLAPKTTRFWQKDISVSKHVSVRLEPVKLKVKSQLTGKLTETKKHIFINKLPKPRFQISYNYSEKPTADNIVQKGEFYKLSMKVSNVGKGKSVEPKISIINKSKARIFLIKGRHFPDELKPGESVIKEMTFKVKGDKKPLKVELSVYDKVFRRGVNRNVVLPKGKSREIEKTNLLGTYKNPVKLWASAKAQHHQLGQGKGEFKINGRIGNLCRLDTGSFLSAFAKCGKTASLNKKKLNKKITLLPHIVTPRIKITKEPEAITSKDSVKIKGSATHPENLKDIYILTNNFDSEKGKQKVLYKTGKGKKIDFAADIPLEKGLNHILIIARHDKVLKGMYIFSVAKEEDKDSEKK